MPTQRMELSIRNVWKSIAPRRGPSLLLYIAKEHCLGDFTKLLGPFSREEFSERPGTLRHDFDEPSLPVVNATISSRRFASLQLI